MFACQDEGDGVVSVAATRVDGDGRRLVDHDDLPVILNDLYRLRGHGNLMSAATVRNTIDDAEHNLNCESTSNTQCV